MVLHGRLCGRVGRRRTFFDEGHAHRAWPSSHSPTQIPIFVPFTVLGRTVLERTVLQHTALQPAGVQPAWGRQRPEVVTRPPVRTRFTITWAGASSEVLTLGPPSGTDWGGRARA